jgi:hypothetical protein
MAARIVNNLPRFTDEVQRKGARGMLQALILGASEAAATTPRETSTLINSQFRKVEIDGTKIVGTVGYLAEYALPVHEAKGTLRGQPRESGKGNYWDPSGEPHFLREGFEQAKPHIDAVIKGSIKT